ncbi:MAG: hypothetical protein M0P01_08945 [Treponema sp.]|nr:hypothetical protein [Treponema sp.]
MKFSKMTFFPVGDKNGGMSLLSLSNGITILIDCAIAADKIADYCDINKELRARLPADSEGRKYVDTFILTHRHDDHLTGFVDNFYLGPLSDYVKGSDKIIIKELWSSHNFWKPESKDDTYKLCDDAKAFNKEMKRRVASFESSHTIQAEGDRAIIIGKDPEGRTEKLSAINYDIGTIITKINENDCSNKISLTILGPLPQQPEENDDDFAKDKNRQSIVLNIGVTEGQYANNVLYGADAECLVWEKCEINYKKFLKYDLLYIPHHCSWHCISMDSISDKGDDAKPSALALSALGHKKMDSCFMVSQSKVIKDDDNDPPSYRAKKEYVKIGGENSQFYCTNEYPDEKHPKPLTFNFTCWGPQKETEKQESKVTSSNTDSTREAYHHG